MTIKKYKVKNIIANENQIFDGIHENLFNSFGPDISENKNFIQHLQQSALQPQFQICIQEHRKNQRSQKLRCTVAQGSAEAQRTFK